MADQDNTVKLQGLKYFRLIDTMLERLRPVGTERDKSRNRELFFDQYATLMLLYFFNPAVTSLRGVQNFTTLEKVQQLCGVKPTALGSLSEAASVFNPEALQPVIAELAKQVMAAPGTMPKAQEAALRGLVAVDGTLLKALPRMAWALWQSPTQRAAKVHVAFSVFPGVPEQVSVTSANASERQELRQFVKPGGFYVADRGYANNEMFREFDAQDVRFLIRVQQNTTYEILQENVLTDADVAAGVVSDVCVRRLGTDKHNPLLEKPLRIVKVQGSEPDQIWILATNARELPAELIKVAYQYRWQVELFFRWMKCILGCRHLLSQSESGVTLQVYAAIIASMLISLWTGAKPSKRTYEMLCFYLSGWATLDELDAHLKKLKTPKPP